MRKRWDPSSDAFEDAPSEPPDAGEIYDEVGEQFHIEWRNGQLYIDTDDLPDEVTEADVAAAIRARRP